MKNSVREWLLLSIASCAHERRLICFLNVSFISTSVYFFSLRDGDNDEINVDGDDGKLCEHFFLIP